MTPRKERGGTFMGLAAGQWLQMFVGAAVASGGAFGGFQYGRGAEAQTIAEQGRKIEHLQQNYEKIQEDTSNIKERLARVEQGNETQLVIQNQIFDMIRDIRAEVRK